MIPKLFAFDLDGTLLNSDKRVSEANAAALREIRAGGAAVALASGRLGSGVRRYAGILGIDTPLVILNGAEVYVSSGKDAPRVYYAPLDAMYAKYLMDYGKDKPIAVNFYHQDVLYTVWSANPDKLLWTHLYTDQTGVEYRFINDFSSMESVSPSKIIFVGEPSYIDKQEAHFRSLWGDGSVYVCRSWDHYLEFMNPKATKGIGLKALCDALGIGLAETAAYGDAENDMPMLEAAGTGVAMKNAPERVKACAERVTELSNDEDWVAREWERWRKG